ncbi:apolipoprotein N-acyltransferase [Legionella bononiensis]|uniref:Apolipoprotein N-acyltransferase n=1 Tax=Legionella bononiensis TaxID=2793102 RepID=A0ABS1WBJ0_9GAMM|nr:apolipoprotein N-acyltransferase [Legionella bononiensis]MBL7481012.1 apolipoprotein N-acyltransferase [Legionella bononiensis]MBL7526720.1 apolipoprotein N-acyltransferase [Legionella bononiensis]MBL7564127.1 apolipoprotein N-acyltransferase [Legionella bononiensis]
MKPAALTNSLSMDSSIRINQLTYLFVFFAGLLGPLGFAPFHMPGLTIISLALLFSSVLNCTKKQGFMLGFLFGLGYFGFGVSWVIVSIHDYGQLNYVLAGITTLAFIAYLALFPALVVWFFKVLDLAHYKLFTLLLFSTLWCLSEFVRSSLFSGFPWLIAGTTQIDTPLKYLAPIIGLQGLSFICVFLACLLTVGIREHSIRRFYYLCAFVLILIIPTAGQYVQWTQVKNDPVSIGVIQANLSMRDKWDEQLFWQLLKYYEETTDKLLGKQLIILPESAIPLPASYLEDYLDRLHEKALKAKSSLILGILQPTDTNETHYYNSIISLGTARGEHVKNQLVPFGEYIPKPFVAINRWMNLPEPNILPGKPHQPLINIANHPIASLICYEIAYPNIVRLQMPLAQWIVSISDNGWFGRSLASYQQLQMAQMLSLLTGRFQVVVNNDGLSSVINNQGEVLDSLPPFSSGILQSEIFPAVGTTPWVLWYEYPVLIICALILVFALFLQVRRLTKQ